MSERGWIINRKKMDDLKKELSKILPENARINDVPRLVFCALQPIKGYLEFKQGYTSKLTKIHYNCADKLVQ